MSGPPPAKKRHATTVRVAVGGISHETNTFATYCMGLTQTADFSEGNAAGCGPLRGDAILENFAGTRTYMGGYIAAARALEIELVPLLMAEAEPSGTISDTAYESMRDELIDMLRENLELYDAVALVLHGAGVAESYEDIELDIGAKVRKVIGLEVPLVSTWDLHGNISEECVAVFDGMCNIRTYPHIDCYERAWDAMHLVPQLLSGRLKPTRYLERVPTLLPLARMCTMDGHPACELRLLCESKMRDHPQVVECSVFHGFPYADVSIVGTSVYCMTNADARLAKSVAKEIAAWIWSNRDKFRLSVLDAKSAVVAALARERSLILLHESSDNTGAGAPGDSTHLLRAFMEAKLPLGFACFGPFWDPQVAQQAHAAGVGAIINISLGGKHYPEMHGAPILAAAQVRCLTDGDFRWSGPMDTGLLKRLGKSARLIIGNVDVVVSSNRVQPYDAEPLKLHGIDITQGYKLVGIKSSIHFRAFFSALATEIITADEPGLSSGRLEIFESRRTALHRPKSSMWAVDEDNASYEP